MEVAGTPPVNTQFQLVGLLVERSVKVTFPPAHSVVGDPEKAAVGARGQLVMVMYPVLVMDPEP